MVAVAGLALLLAGCSSGSDAVAGLPDDATVTYAFHDSSVPPPYHRSVTLTVTREESHLVIDSYGDVLADETVATAPGVWAALGDRLPEMAGLAADEPGEGCVGGTGMDLRVESAGAALVDLSPQFCGGSHEGLEATIAAFIRPAREQFPPTDVLAPEGQ